MFRKILVLSIIVLFTIVSIIPATGRFTTKINYNGESNYGNYKFQKTRIETSTSKTCFSNNVYDIYKTSNNSDHFSSSIFGKLNSILWEYQDNRAIPIVSFCENGTYTWVGQSLNNQRFQLFKTNGLGTPEWEYVPISGYDIWQIDSSAKESILAGVCVKNFGESSILYKWDSSNRIPEWHYIFPNGLLPCDLCVSADGSRIVVSIYNLTQDSIKKILVFDADSSKPTMVFPLEFQSGYFGLYLMDLSYDGSIILLSCAMGVLVIDTNISEIRHQTHGHPAISANGSILAIDRYYPSTERVLTVFEWDSVKEEYVYLWEKFWAPENYHSPSNGHILDVSADGSTVMVGSYLVGENTTILVTKVAMFDIPSGKLLWTHDTEGEGKYQDCIYDIRLSDNGNRAVVSYWGDEFNSHDELMVFSRNSPVPIFSIDSPGSMYSVDISPNGEFAVGGGKILHANILGCGGIIYAINITRNNPPNKPTIKGPISGKPGTEHTYIIITTDPEGDEVSYFIDWGDGTSSGWIRYRPSGIEFNSPHIWDMQGSYEIKVKAKDVYNAESDWTALEVSMPKNNIPSGPFYKFLQNHPRLFPLSRHWLELQR